MKNLNRRGHRGHRVDLAATIKKLWALSVLGGKIRRRAG